MKSNMTANAEKRQELTCCTGEQVKKLLELIKGTPLYSFVIMTCTYGMPLVSLLDLRWEDVDFNNDVITIQRETANSLWKVQYPMLPEIRIMFETMLTEQRKNMQVFEKDDKNNGFVYVHKNGHRCSQRYPLRQLKKAAEQYNLPPIRWNDLKQPHKFMIKILSEDNMTDVTTIGCKGPDKSLIEKYYQHNGNKYNNQFNDRLIAVLDIN